MNTLTDSLVDQLVIEWDGRPGAFLTRTKPVEGADGDAARILRAFPMIGTWDDAFQMADCAAARLGCGMDLREFSYADGQPIVTLHDNSGKISVSEPAFNRLLTRLFGVMIAAAEQAQLDIVKHEDWPTFRQNVEALAAR